MLANGLKSDGPQRCPRFRSSPRISLRTCAWSILSLEKKRPKRSSPNSTNWICAWSILSLEKNAQRKPHQIQPTGLWLLSSSTNWVPTGLWLLSSVSSCKNRCRYSRKRAARQLRQITSPTISYSPRPAPAGGLPWLKYIVDFNLECSRYLSKRKTVAWVDKPRMCVYCWMALHSIRIKLLEAQTRCLEKGRKADEKKTEGKTK